MGAALATSVPRTRNVNNGIHCTNTSTVRTPAFASVCGGGSGPRLSFLSDHCVMKFWLGSSDICINITPSFPVFFLTHLNIAAPMVCHSARCVPTFTELVHQISLHVVNHAASHVARAEKSCGSKVWYTAVLAIPP